MQLTPREFDKLIIYMMAEVALKRKAKGTQAQLSGSGRHHLRRRARGRTRGQDDRGGRPRDARTVLTKDDVMDGVADLIPMVQVEAVFTDGSRLVTVHTPIQ